MNDTTDTTEPSPTSAPVARPPLRRSISDRKIAGVAGGLGRYFNVDPLIFRVVLVTLAIFGGSGLLLYAIGWLLVPEEGDDESEVARLAVVGERPNCTGATAVGSPSYIRPRGGRRNHGTSDGQAVADRPAAGDRIAWAGHIRE